ncbi:DUF3043 domain-containing protein [Rhizomonospora bruguierae]|uniref:DUF3043 domain-containing protein n=1 Tax=Rhizomonospora bruguierae TaxID=1581705 RepID=UPI001BD13D6C|nr:DUF3043 domain-containing protein [Micromonospora sp. NBRC 107566]
MPSLFRRRSTDLVDEATGSVAEATPEPETAATPARPRSYTPSKKDLGVVTPKRGSSQRRTVVEAPSNRREAVKRARERQRAERAEASAGMRAGDERYLLARDKGPERALVRDIVDSRYSIGTWFFGGALVVLVGSNGAMPLIVRQVSNLLWAFLALAMIVDGVFISRKVKRLVRERFPKTTQRMGSLYMYAVMRSITFRRMRIPRPRIAIGAKP